jgi:penicillin-binding protein A
VNRQVRRLGAALIALYLVLFVQLNLVQVFRAEEYADNPANTRRVQREFNRERGLIVTADDEVAAETTPVADDMAASSNFTLQRRYPLGPLLAPVTGYISYDHGATGVEAAYDDELLGTTLGQQLAGWRDLFVERSPVGDVRLTVHASLQRTAADALGDRPGAVVVLDPRTGELLALWSTPTFDPNRLADPNLAASSAAWSEYVAAPGNPLLSHAYQERYAPGSTFKVVTVASGLRTGTVTPDQPVYPVEAAWTPPLTDVPITNFGGSSCGGTMIQLLRVSCNTGIARMAVETVGAEGMVAAADAFGFNSTVPIDLPGATGSVFPTNFERDAPRLAQASIGQNDVAATPLQMALVSAAVGNGGRMMRPTTVDRVTDRAGRTVRSIEPSLWRTPLDEAQATVLRSAMVDVAARGTATILATPGVEVGAKTGTAQLGDSGRQHTWITAFAGPAGRPAEVALAVVVLNQSGGDATGSAIAGPIARRVLDAALALPPRSGR